MTTDAGAEAEYPRTQPSFALYTSHSISAAAHALLLGAAAAFAPPLGVDDGAHDARIDYIAQALRAAEPAPQVESVASPPGEAEDTTVQGSAPDPSLPLPAAIPGGSRGLPAPRLADKPQPTVEVTDTSHFGMLGLLQDTRTRATTDWNFDVPSLASGRLEGLFNDPEPGGSLGLSGAGFGSGGPAAGVALGRIGTAKPKDRAPAMRLHDSGAGHHLGAISRCGDEGSGEGGNQCTTSVSGRLPPESIQRVIRQNFGRLRACYDAGLRGNPGLSGRVTVRFVIGRDGSVSSAQAGASDLPNSDTVACVVRSFFGISFPPPEGGIVHVVYPVLFAPTNP